MFAERLVCSWIGALSLATGAYCQTYVQFFVGEITSPQSINEKGEIAGTAMLGKGPFTNQGFVRDPNGTITTFDVPGTFGVTFASSINDEGAITGSFGVPSRSDGFIRDPEGNFTTFDAPGSIATGAASINAGGAVTGSYEDSNNVVHGFVRRANGTLISFDPPGSVGTFPVSINAKGAITGSYQDANNRTHGFLRRAGGTIVSFDVPGSTGTFPTNINDARAITGRYTVANGRTFALCAIHMGNSPRSTRVWTHSRRVSTTKERLRAVTRRQTVRPALCGRRMERLPHSFRRFASAWLLPQASTTKG